MTPTNLPALREAVATIAARRQSGSSSFPREGGVVIYSTDLLGEKAVSDLVGAAPALLDELEAEREKHDEGAYDDMKAAKDKAEADLAAARAVLDSTIWPSSEANGRLLLNVDAAAWHAWWQARKGLTP